MFNIYLGIIILLALIIVLAVWIYFLSNKIKKLLSGKDGSSLESIILRHNNEIELLAKKELENSELIKTLQNKFTKSIQGIGIVRFNPFRESGGNHSFAIALVDEDNNGVIISTMHARERTNMYAREIIAGKCEIDLTDEEKKALLQAMEN